VHWVATECSQNDGSKTQYYYIILDRLQDCSGGVERALESRIRGPLTLTSQNKFEILVSRVMKYGVELRRQEAKHKE